MKAATWGTQRQDSASNAIFNNFLFVIFQFQFPPKIELFRSLSFIRTGVGARNMNGISKKDEFPFLFIGVIDIYFGDFVAWSRQQAEQRYYVRHTLLLMIQRLTHINNK